MIHKDCGTRLRQQYVCPSEGEKVERDQIVKGYEFSKDQYVLFTDEELKAVAEETNKTIEIKEFVPITKVDPVYFDKPYYLGPDKGGDRAYRLLSRAMEKAGLVALARYAARGKLYLVMIRPIEDGLVMQQLHYVDEIRPLADIPLGDPAEIKEAEVDLALQLIEQNTSDAFEPDKYEDDVRKRLEEIIQQKVDGQEVTISTPDAPKAQVIDLMDALKASLGVADGGEAKPKAAKASKSAKKSGSAKGRKKASK
jgi:DNA end-binding protein Ku